MQKYIEKKLLNNAKRAKFDVSLKNYLQSDSTKSNFRYVIYVTPKKLHAKTEEKLLERFWDRSLPSFNLDGRTDGRTDGQLGIRKAPLPFGWRS